MNMCRLIMLYPVEKTFDFEKDLVTLGRHKDCDIVLDINQVSRKHAQIGIDKDKNFYLKDLKSTNGSLVNRKVINNDEITLYNGDFIEIGKAGFVFQCNRFTEKSFSERFQKEYTDLVSRITECSPHDLVAEVLGRIMELCIADTVVLFRKGQADELLPFFSPKGQITPQEIPGINVSKSVINNVLESETEVCVNNAALDKSLSKYKSIILRKIENIYCAPIKIDKTVKGVLYVHSQTPLLRALEKDRLEKYNNLLSMLLAIVENVPLASEKNLVKKKSPETNEFTQQLKEHSINWMLPRDQVIAVSENQIIGEYINEDKLFFNHPLIGVNFETKQLYSKIEGCVELINGFPFIHEALHLKKTIHGELDKIPTNCMVLIDINIKNGCSIESNYDIKVKGSVGNSNINSISGSAEITGIIDGQGKNYVRAFKDVLVTSGLNTYLKAHKDIIVKTGLAKTVVNAGRDAVITASESFHNNVIAAGRFIKIDNQVKGSESGYLELSINTMLVMNELEELKLDLLRESGNLPAFAPEFQRIINQIKFKKNFLSEIPQAKKFRLFKHVDDFDEMMIRKILIDKRLITIDKLLNDLYESTNYIEFRGLIPEGTHIFINGASMEVDKPMHNMVFSNKDGAVYYKGI